jgi:hypothetical protein
MKATIVTTTILNNLPSRTEQEINLSGSGMTMIVHQQGMKVDVPDFIEVNAQDTLRCMDEMTQPQWEWISEGGPFKFLWNEAFDPADRTDPPTSIEVLNMSDMGLRHMAGIIVLGCEAAIAGKNVFFRNPETYLHPKTQRYIVDMFRKLLQIFGKSGEIKVKVKEYTKKDGTVVKAHERTQKVTAAVAPVDPDENVAQCLNWLQKLQDHYGVGKDIAATPSGERLTVEQLMDAVNQDTPRGQWFIGEYVKLRDGE